MNEDQARVVLSGLGIILLLVVSLIESNFILELFSVSFVVMFILFLFYNKDRKINYLIALFCVNIFQWIISIYFLFNNLAYIKTEFVLIISAPFFTIVLVNIIRKNHLKNPPKIVKKQISMLKDKTKLILLFTGIILIIGSLACFIAYFYPIFLYGITLGLMTFIYGFYHENKKVKVSKRHDIMFQGGSISNTLTKNINVTKNYAISIGFLLILQYIIIIHFAYQISKEDLKFAIYITNFIALFFSIQIYRSDLKIFNRKIFNRKKEIIHYNEERYYNKGKAYQQLHQYREALKCYNKALELNPNFKPALKAVENLSKSKI